MSSGNVLLRRTGPRRSLTAKAFAALTGWALARHIFHSPQHGFFFPVPRTLNRSRLFIALKNSRGQPTDFEMIIPPQTTLRLPSPTRISEVWPRRK